MQDSLTLSKITVSSYMEVQRILDSASYYYMKVEGVPKLENTAKGIFESIPPNCNVEDKAVYFVELNDIRIGIVDVVNGYPDKTVFFIGLLLLDEKFHGKGLGQKIYLLIEDLARKLGASSIQLGVNDTNDVGMKFWKALGFVPNGRTRAYEGRKVNSLVHVFEKKLTTKEPA